MQGCMLSNYGSPKDMQGCMLSNYGRPSRPVWCRKLLLKQLSAINQ